MEECMGQQGYQVAYKFRLSLIMNSTKMKQAISKKKSTVGNFIIKVSITNLVRCEAKMLGEKNFRCLKVKFCKYLELARKFH